MRTRVFKGYDCFPPGDEFTVLLYERLPCLKSRRKLCENAGICLGSIGNKYAKSRFNKCRYVEVRVGYLGEKNPRKFTILKESKIKFK